MIVLDASVCVEWALHTSLGDEVAVWLQQHDTLHAPYLLDIEVAQVLRRYAQRREISAERAYRSLGHVVDLGIERYEHQILLPRIWQLRENLSAYDAAYVALAEVLDAPLLTADKRLAAAPGHRATIHTLG